MWGSGTSMRDSPKPPDSGDRHTPSSPQALPDSHEVARAKTYLIWPHHGARKAHQGRARCGQMGYFFQIWAIGVTNGPLTVVFVFHTKLFTGPARLPRSRASKNRLVLASSRRTEGAPGSCQVRATAGILFKHGKSERPMGL